MVTKCGIITPVLVLFCLAFLPLSPATAAGTVLEVVLNNQGFTSYEHFKAELYLNNYHDALPDAWIFSILEIMNEFYYWPDFGSDVNYQINTIEPGESWITCLELDFPDIGNVIPFGPMFFWGAWYVDIDHYEYDVKEFWLDEEHKWTATPTITPTPPPTASFTPAPPTGTPTPVVYEPGDLYSFDLGVRNMRYIEASGREGFFQGSSEEEPCNHAGEYPRFNHILTRNLAVMETEVSRRMWWYMQGLKPNLPDDPTQEEYGSDRNSPVQSVTWFECLIFANFLSRSNGFTQCYYTDAEFTTPVNLTNYTTGPFYCNFDADGYRLPTEGEWEYFARAGTTGEFSCDEPNYSAATCDTPFCVFDEFPNLQQHAVFCANDNDSTEKVGLKTGNPWNLKDVHGNVREWCWDWFEAAYPSGPVTDYAGSETGQRRVVRGGGWDSWAQECRSAFRANSPPYSRKISLGFRLVRTIP